MVWVVAAFLLAFIGVVSLFALKHWENTRSRTLFPELRQSADEKTRRLKAKIFSSTQDLEKLPPYAAHLLGRGLHRSAVAFGHLAHWVGERSHDLADLVSHKHRFERRETNSDFLKQVNEHPMHVRTSDQENGDLDLRGIPAVLLDDAQKPGVSSQENESSAEIDSPAKKTRKKKVAQKTPKTTLGENENI